MLTRQCTDRLSATQLENGLGAAHISALIRN